MMELVLKRNTSIKCRVHLTAWRVGRIPTCAAFPGHGVPQSGSRRATDRVQAEGTNKAAFLWLLQQSH